MVDKSWVENCNAGGTKFMNPQAIVARPLAGASMYLTLMSVWPDAFLAKQLVHPTIQEQVGGKKQVPLDRRMSNLKLPGAHWLINNLSDL